MTQICRKIVITIDTSNEAFQKGNLKTQVAIILLELSKKIVVSQIPDVYWKPVQKLYDTNGNPVGNITVTEE